MPLSDPRRIAEMTPEVVEIPEDTEPLPLEPDDLPEGKATTDSHVALDDSPSGLVMDGGNTHPEGLSEPGSAPQGAELILAEILEESAPELFAFVEEIALGPKVTPRSNPYKQSQAVLKHINFVQQKAENFIDRFFDKLPPAAVIALRDKNWVKHRGSRSRAPTVAPEGVSVKDDILGQSAIGQAKVAQG